MKSSHRLLQAFDTEVAQLSLGAGVEMKRHIDRASQQLRPGLIAFYDRHGRLPKSVKELLESNFKTSEFDRFIRNPTFDFGSGQVHEVPISAFLSETQYIIDGGHSPNWTTKVALKLLHAVYREDRSDQWKHASRTLTKRGFTDDQIREMRFDAEVRRACLKLLRPRFG